MSIFQSKYADIVSAEGKETLPAEYPDEMHVACVVLLDTSDSMRQSGAINDLNEAIKRFVDNLKHGSSVQRKCIDLAMVSFGKGGVTLIHNFRAAETVKDPEILYAGDLTPMGNALNLAMDLIEQRKSEYKEENIPYHRPWIFCITDGFPNDEYKSSVERLKNMEATNGVIAYCAGTKGYNYEILSGIFEKGRIFDIANEDFLSLFEFLKNSLVATQGSKSGEQPDVPVPKNVTVKMG